MFLFSSEEGKSLVSRLLLNLWPFTPHDHQLEAVTKALDGTDVLAILPTGAGKTAILVMFMLILKHMKENSGEFGQHTTRISNDPIMIVVYPTNCLEEEQVRVHIIKNTKSNALNTICLGNHIQRGRAHDRRHQCRNSRTLRDVEEG
jgi:ATP-dependent helicase YprA (DUF1998 family)